jgi:hypothetical protein
VADTANDPGPLGVVLGNGVFVFGQYEHMFPSASRLAARDSTGIRSTRLDSGGAERAR